MVKTKGTPLTMEMFEEAIFPRIEQLFDEKVHQMETKFLESEERVMGEIHGLREEVSITLHQYKRTNKRVDEIDKHLGINTVMDE
jgi:hypothetical protein